MVAHYYRNVSAVVFVYDLSCPKSFANLVGWIKEARSQVSRQLTGVRRPWHIPN